MLLFDFFIQQYKLYRFITVQILQGFIEVLSDFFGLFKRKRQILGARWHEQNNLIVGSNALLCQTLTWLQLTGWKGAGRVAGNNIPKTSTLGYSPALHKNLWAYRYAGYFCNSAESP